MASQDAILPLVPRIAPIVPPTREDVVGVVALSPRPVIEKDWDRKHPVAEDRVYDRQQAQHQDGQAADHQHEDAHDSQPEPTATAAAEDGHIDTFA